MMDNAHSAQGRRIGDLLVPQYRVENLIRAQMQAEDPPERITAERTTEPDYDGGVLYRVRIGDRA